MRRLVLLVLFIAVAVSIAGAAYAALAARDLSAARSDLMVAKNKTRSFAFAEARDSLEQADDRLLNARDRLDSVPLIMLRVVPGIGRNIDAVEVIASAAQDAVSGARFALSAADALPSKESFRFQDGRFPDVDWGSVGNASAEAADSFGDAKEAVEEIRNHDLLGPIERARDEFLAEVTEARNAARNLQLGAGVLPDLLGVTETRHHLIVVQNAAERRATGGAIESFMLLRARDRRLSFVRADPDEAVTGSPRDVDAAHRLNLDPDFSQVGLRIADAYAETTGVHADTVITVDQVAIANLLNAVGEITVDGVSVDGDNAVRFLSRDVLDKYPVEPGQSVFLGRLSRALADRLLSGGFAVPDLVEQTGLAASGKHILVWARDGTAQKTLEEVGVTGSAVFDRSEPTDPLVTAVIGNNPSPAEMDYYARRSISYEVFLHEDRTADVSVKVTLHNRVRRGELPGIVIAKSNFGDLRQRVSLYLGEAGLVSTKNVTVRAGRDKAVSFPVEQVPIQPGRFTMRVIRQPGLFEDELTVRVKLPPGSAARGSLGFTEGLVYQGAPDDDMTFSVTW